MKTCDACKWYVLPASDPHSYNHNGKRLEVGECYYSPPTVFYNPNERQQQNCRPTVHYDDYCSKFSKRRSKQPPALPHQKAYSNQIVDDTLPQCWG